MTLKFMADLSPLKLMATPPTFRKTTYKGTLISLQIFSIFCLHFHKSTKNCPKTLLKKIYPSDQSREHSKDKAFKVIISKFRWYRSLAENCCKFISHPAMAFSPVRKWKRKGLGNVAYNLGGTKGDVVLLCQSRGRGDK